MKLNKLTLSILALSFLTFGCSSDDNAPQATPIVLQNLEVTIDENPINGDVVGTVQSNSTSPLTFSIVSQTPLGALEIDATSGELTVLDAGLFDFETNSTITALISSSGAVNTATVTINLNNIAEVNVQNFNSTIDENPTNGQSLGTVVASGDATLTYSITTQSPSGALSINPTTGLLTVLNATLFDYETSPTITATVQVDNSGTNENLTVTINLLDKNELGEYKYGGVIFWINPANDSHGLVCALSNQTTASWGCLGVSTGATGTAIGTGAANTAAIVAAGCGSGSAAEFVSNLNLNGYNDWFLPSLDEFNEFSTNYNTYIWPTIQANGGSALSATIWTSTEVNGNNAYIDYIGNYAPTVFPKDINNINVLPVRAF